MFFRCLQSLTLSLYMWSCVRLKHCYGSHRAQFYRFISWPACHRIHKDIYIMVALIGILNSTHVCAFLGPTGRCWNLSFSDFFSVSCHWHQTKFLYLIYSSTSANLILKFLFSKCIVRFLTAISSESTIWKVLLAWVSLFKHYQIMATDIKYALPVDQNQHVQIHNVLRINSYPKDIMVRLHIVKPSGDSCCCPPFPLKLIPSRKIRSGRRECVIWVTWSKRTSLISVRNKPSYDTLDEALSSHQKAIVLIATIVLIIVAIVTHCRGCWMLHVEETVTLILSTKL